MNFIPPPPFLDDRPPVEYVPKESKNLASSTLRVKRKTSLASLWNRNDLVEDVPAVPEIPAAFATLISRTDETTSFSVNETPSLDRIDDSRATVRGELIVNGVSFMDLSSSDSESERASETPALLHQLRRVISKTDLTTPNESSPAPTSSPSLAPSVPSSPGVDNPGFREHVRRLTDASSSPAQRASTFTNSSSADFNSLRSFTSSKPQSSPRGNHGLSARTPENPPLDPDFAFDEFITSYKPLPMHSPRIENYGRSGKRAPPVDSRRSFKHETVLVQATRESIDGCASFLSQPKTRGLPMPDTIDQDEEEWNRAVNWVRAQEAERVTREAAAAKAEDQKIRSETAQRTRQERDAQVDIGLAKQFIHRTSTSWVPRHNLHELQTDEDRHNAIAEALTLASKHETSDPGFTELRKRFFTGITNQFSRLPDGRTPKSTPLPCRPGWSTPPVAGSICSLTRTRQFTGSSITTDQTYTTCPVSPMRSGQRESQLSPSISLHSITNENEDDGLGILMKTPDPETRDVAIDGLGPSVLAVPVSPGQSLRSQRNAWSPGQAESSYTPQHSPQNVSSDSSARTVSSLAINDAKSREHLQSSASATLASTRIFKVDRDSRIQDRYVPKRGSALYQTLDAARELAEARMGMPIGPLPALPFPRKDSVFDNTPAPVPKMNSNPSGDSMFKRAAKHPTLRAMVSSLSLRSPDATEMVQSPVTPTIAIHPAFRSNATSPVTPTAKGHRQTMAQRFTGKTKPPRASTSTTSSDAVMTPLSGSPSQKSLVSAATGEDRWAQRVRQKSKVEQAWKESGILNAPSQQPPLDEMFDLVSTAHLIHSSKARLPGASQLSSSLKTPTSPISVPSDPTSTSVSNPGMGQNLSPHLNRKTQDSPTPLNIRKVTLSPKMQSGLSLPGSPASLQFPKLRTHPAVRRVLEQDLKGAPDTADSALLPENEKDPFAKSGSISKGDRDWPLPDSSTNNAAPEDQQSDEQYPLEGQFDRIITSWRHASATQDSTPSNSVPMERNDTAGNHQYVRNYLELDLLHAPTDKAHPNHSYRWNSMNVMCKDIHNDAPNFSDAISAEKGDPSVRFCSFCRESCCYFGLQVGLAEVQTIGRDQALEELKNKARSHVFFLRGTCPKGIEDYQVLMECALCDRICCPSCTSICQIPMCTEPVCKECVELEDGVCGLPH